MRIAIQMDDFGSVDAHADSTYALMREAAHRGYELFYYLPEHLYYDCGDIKAQGRGLTYRNDKLSVSEAEPSTINLRDFDVVLMRQDPPFDMSYITATHILELLGDDVLVVNNPAAVRNSPEKLLALHFADLIAPTLIGRDLSAIRSFRETHRDIIIKPLFGNGGLGVFFIKENDVNFASLLEMFLRSSREPLMVQKFLAEVSHGDKRIILSDGEPIGAINRMPPAGEIRSNMHIGGVAQKSELNPRDLEICSRLGPYLRESGLIFTGIDVIGGYLSEINVTSPTGLQEINRFDKSNPAGTIWDDIEKRL